MNQKIEPLLEARDIHVAYGDLKILHGISMSFGAGEIVAIMGPNGCGKTTMLKSMFGLAPVTSGSVWYHGKHIHPVAHEMVASGVAYVPQGRRVFTQLTVAENIEMGGYFLNNATEVRRRMAEVLDIFPALKPKFNEMSGGLSGGQQQMLAIARGLMTNPDVLLLDEPTLGLSPKIVNEVFEVVSNINKTRGTTVVIVEHNIKSLLPITDRIYVMDKGVLLYDGTASNFQKTNLFEEVFLGRTA